VVVVVVVAVEAAVDSEADQIMVVGAATNLDQVRITVLVPL
jgi:hypothetical protein